VTGKYINVKARDGKEFKAYVAEPNGAAGPGILLIQEIFGVNHHIRGVADKLAGQGYVVVAPDLFFRLEPGFEVGYSGDDMTKAFRYYEQFDEKTALSDLGCAVEALRKLPECNGKVGVIGFCLGGKMSYRLSAHHKVEAAVSYYGGGIDGFLSEAQDIKCPIIFHYGALDAHIPMSSVDKVKDAFKGRDEVSVYVYENADHGFNCDELASYNPEAAKVAWSRTLSFFGKFIGPQIKSSV